MIPIQGKFKGNILAASYAKCKFDEYWSCNPKDYDGDKSKFLEDTEKMSIYHQISHKALGRYLPNFRFW